jgi:hypothetical protein
MVIIPNSSMLSSAVVVNGLIMGVSSRISRSQPDERQLRPFALPACFSVREICNDL